MAIRETDLMLVCFEASKSVVGNYNAEVNNALRRIATAMCEIGQGPVTVERMEDNPVERDILERSLIGTIGLIMEVKERG